MPATQSVCGSVHASAQFSGAAAVRAQLEQLQPTPVISIPSESLGDKRSSLGALRAQLYAVDPATSQAAVYTLPRTGKGDACETAAIRQRSDASTSAHECCDLDGPPEGVDAQATACDGNGSGCAPATMCLTQNRGPSARRSGSHGCGDAAEVIGLLQEDCSAVLDEGPLSFVANAAVRPSDVHGARSMLQNFAANTCAEWPGADLRFSVSSKLAATEQAMLALQGAAPRQMQ